MSKPAFTPGPWQVSGVRTKLGGEPILSVGPDSMAIAAVYYGNGSAAQHVAAHADARLIAAAPELYEALVGLLNTVDTMDVHPSKGGGVLPVDKALATHAARAALAKAEGTAA